VHANLRGFDLTRLREGDPGGLASERIELRHVASGRLDIDDASIDLVVSHSAIEHVRDVHALVAELARITKPGGYGIHLADVTDHRHYQDPSLHPLEFLTVASDEPVVHGGNRLRLHELAGAFTEGGFELVHFEFGGAIDVAAIRNRLAEPWRSMPDELLDRACGQSLVRRL
jgi:SAM-dependent methyltransferase